MDQRNSKVSTTAKRISPGDLQRLLALIDSIQYGSVTVIIQDGKVIQIDKSEKIRLV